MAFPQVYDVIDTTWPIHADSGKIGSRLQVFSLSAGGAPLGSLSAGTSGAK
jgi:hypothetical protein